MGLKRKLAIIVLALGSFAVVTGVGTAPAGAATPDNLITNAQYDMLWPGMSQQALESFLSKQLTNTDWGTFTWVVGDVTTNYEVWTWESSFGNCQQAVSFVLVDTDPDGTVHPMTLSHWYRIESPECAGIVK